MPSHEAFGTRPWNPHNTPLGPNVLEASPDLAQITEAKFLSTHSCRINPTASQNVGVDTPAGTTSEGVPSSLSRSTSVQTGFELDLNNYLPLGCYCYRHNNAPKLSRGGDASGWQHASCTQEALDKEDHYFKSFDLLLCAKWIRLSYKVKDEVVIVRTYVLPDDVARRYLDRSDSHLRVALGLVIGTLVVSRTVWQGNPRLAREETTKKAVDETSLFYLFNMLPSPTTNATVVKDKYTSRAIEILLDQNQTIKGLKTQLYPYQRRAAATMLEKESSPGFQLDPRLEEMTASDGSKFYYDRENHNIYRNARHYELARGGILAETMGLGKTLICLAVILASKGHWPQIPVEYSQDLVPTRKTSGALVEMCASAISRHSIPWRCFFTEAGNSQCIRKMEQNLTTYEIPRPAARSLRQASVVAKSRKITLCEGTLIVVPNNLLVQWRSEIDKHTEKDSLRTLVVDGRKELPEVSELASYDVVLFSKTRWEREIRDGEDAKGRRKSHGKQAACSCTYVGATRERDCQCFNPEDVYHSPLGDLHWLRIIVDEGHSFASSGFKTNAVLVAESLQVERRWVVSGTPTKGLIGVEVELAANENMFPNQDLHDANVDPAYVDRSLALEKRKVQQGWSQERNDLEKIGRIAADFLKMRPWANSQHDDPSPSWMKRMCITDNRSNFQGYSSCLRNTLQGMMIKTRPEDVEKDLELPPLYNRLVYIEPSFYDKLSLNLFAMVLNVNAITSERQDKDYLFHSKNKKRLHELIANLREGGFFWSGFGEKDVGESLKFAKTYRDKKCESESSLADFDLLDECISAGACALESSGWKAFSRFHELGMFVNAFPKAAANEWALDSEGQKEPLLVGMTQLKAAQRHVNDQLYSSDPSKGLEDAGRVAMGELRTQASRGRSDVAFDQRVVLASSVTGTPLTMVVSSSDRISTGGKGRESHLQSDQPSSPVVLKSAMKRSRANCLDFELSSESCLLKTVIVGTASSKLSYLIDRIMDLYKDEKILVFYEGENIAYYIAQALELLDVRFLIYAKSLPTPRRAAYVVTFNTTETFRVLLMDVHQASHGLNISSASRVFFVNAIWQPSVEAQAIKRAHRIGQLRPVYVETLVLRESMEDRMLQRRKAMSNQEHQQAERSLLNDAIMSSIIQDARFLRVSSGNIDGYQQMAPLTKPQQVFARPGRGGTMPDNPDADLLTVFESPPSKSSRKAKARVIVASPTMSGDEASPSRKREVDALRSKDPAASGAVLGGGILMTPTKKRSRPKARKSVGVAAVDRAHEPAGLRSSVNDGNMGQTADGDSQCSSQSITSGSNTPRTPTASFQNGTPSSIFGGD